ncbi:MAG: putative sigma-54 modulation protein [Lentisphaeria bacterium]|jgi:putative sigma-54 modulation protein
MRLQIHSRHVDINDTLREHIKHKIQIAFSRLEQHISRVLIRISDVNGPKGGIDKYCHLELSIDHKENIIIKDRQAELHTAIHSAIQRASRTLTRRLARRQHQKTTGLKILINESDKAIEDHTLMSDAGDYRHANS